MAVCACWENINDFDDFKVNLENLNKYLYEKFRIMFDLKGKVVFWTDLVMPEETGF